MSRLSIVLIVISAGLQFGCESLTEEEACHLARWRLAEEARSGTLRGVEVGACSGFETDSEHGIGSIELEATYERNPGKASSFFSDRWQPAESHTLLHGFRRTDQGWRPDTGDWPPSGGKPGNLTLSVERISGEGSAPAASGTCEVRWSAGSRPASGSIGPDGTCVFEGVKAGDIFSISPDVPDSWGWTMLLPVREKDIDGSAIAVQVLAEPSVRIRTRDALADTDGLEATVHVDGTAMATEAGVLTLPSVVHGKALSLRAQAEGYIPVEQTVVVDTPPPWVQEVAVDFLPEVPADASILATSPDGTHRSPTMKKMPVDLREAFGMGYMQPRVHLSAAAVREQAFVTQSPVIVVRGPIARQHDVLDRHGPVVQGGGGEGLAASITGWVLLPVSEWKGGALPPDRFDLTPRRASMAAGAIIGAQSFKLANSIWRLWPPVDVDWGVSSLEPDARFAGQPLGDAAVYQLPREGLWAICDGIDGDFALIRYQE